MTDTPVPGAPGDRPAAPASLPERALLYAVHACLALVLLTPLVWAPETFHPFSVGKAVWSRSLIAAAFALWALLAALRPHWRPPPSALLAALALGLAAAALSAALGASPQRSLWSTYTRMEGLVDTAHWAAFFVVLTAVLSNARDWRRLLAVHLCVGLAVALAAIARFHAPEAGPFGLLPEGRYPRIAATTANPTFLGAYLQAAALLAAGFLARAFVPAGAGAGARPQQAARRGRAARRPVREPVSSAWPARLFWLAVLACSAFALTLTGSMGALAGLGAGAGAAAALYAGFGRTRRARRLGLAALAALGAGAAVLAIVLAVRAGPSGAPPPPAFDSILLERVTSTERIGNTLGGRLRNWESGLEAFAERPLLGWGAGNYFAASGRYREAPDGRTRITDHAHNMTIETAATTGLAGLAAYILLWGLTAAAVLRLARRAPPREQALAVFAGGALAGWFVQSQTLFYSPESWLQHMLLLAFLASLDAAAPGAGGRGARLRAMFDRALQALHRRTARAAVPLRIAVATGALVLAGASIAANLAACTERLALPRGSGSHVTLGGRRIPLAPAGQAPGPDERAGSGADSKAGGPDGTARGPGSGQAPGPLAGRRGETVALALPDGTGARDAGGVAYRWRIVQASHGALMQARGRLTGADRAAAEYWTASGPGRRSATSPWRYGAKNASRRSGRPATGCARRSGAGSARPRRSTAAAGAASCRLPIPRTEESPGPPRLCAADPVAAAGPSR